MMNTREALNLGKGDIVLYNGRPCEVYHVSALKNEDHPVVIGILDGDSLSFVDPISLTLKKRARP